jgi:hypothetical protein
MIRTYQMPSSRLWNCAGVLSLALGEVAQRLMILVEGESSDSGWKRFRRLGEYSTPISGAVVEGGDEMYGRTPEVVASAQEHAPHSELHSCDEKRHSLARKGNLTVESAPVGNDFIYAYDGAGSTAFSTTSGVRTSASIVENVKLQAGVPRRGRSKFP